MKHSLFIFCFFGVINFGFAQDLIQTIPNAHSKEITALAISENAVFTGGKDATIKVWNTKTGLAIQTLYNANNPIVDLEIRDGELFSAERGSEIYVWDIENFEFKKKLYGHEYYIEDLDLSGNDDWLASASRDNSVRIWDLNSAQNNVTLKGHGKDVRAVAVSQNGKYAAASSADQTLRIWQPEHKGLIKRMNGRQVIHSMAFSRDGRFLVTAVGKQIILWETENWTIQKRLRAHSFEITHLELFSDNQHIATADKSGKIIFWNLETGKVQFSFLPHEGTEISALAFGKGNIFATAANGEIKIWRLNLLKKDVQKSYSKN